MKKIIKVSQLLIFACFIISMINSNGFSQTLEGKVSYETKDKKIPAAEIEVKLVDVGEQNEKYEYVNATLTNSDGHFFFSEIKPGIYCIEVNNAAYIKFKIKDSPNENYSVREIIIK